MPPRESRVVSMIEKPYASPSVGPKMIFTALRANTNRYLSINGIESILNERVNLYENYERGCYSNGIFVPFSR